MSSTIAKSPRRSIGGRLEDTRLLWTILGLAGLVLLLVGSAIGLFAAPTERHMGDVSRMFYVHVPTALDCLFVYLIAFFIAIGSLWQGHRSWDRWLVGTIEAGVILNVLMLVTGMFFARPTWGVWWSWGDVRLITALLGLVLFAGVLGLRSFVTDPERRSTWTAVATIIAFVDVPIIYYCVQWWRSLHQLQSSPQTVDASMVLPFRINAFAILFLAAWMIWMRTRIETERQAAEEVPEPEPAARLVPA